MGSKIIPFTGKKKQEFTELWLNFIQFEVKYNELMVKMLETAQSEGELLQAMNSKDFENLINIRTNNLNALKEKKFGKYIIMP